MVKLTYCLDMTIVVDWDITEQNKQISYVSFHSETLWYIG